MKTQKLGSSDLEIPIVCLGTMTWGVQNTEEEAHQQLDYAVDERGIKFIDTAEIYPVPPSYELQGLTETYIGNWISKRGKRDDLIIATKVSPAPIIRTREETGSGAKLDRKSIREAVEGSLKRLQIDYIDLYQVHWPERPVDKFGERGYQHDDGGHTTIEETLTALTELITEGKIRYIGLSNENPYGVSEFLRLAREKGLAKIVSIQNQYSLLNRKYEMANAELCLKNEVSLLAYSALSMGVLSGKYLDGARPKGARMSESMRNSHYNSDLVQEPTRRYVELAKKHGIDPSTLALQFAASKPFTASVIIGATTMDQLKANIDAFETPLPEKLKQEIEKIYLEFPDPHA